MHHFIRAAAVAATLLYPLGAAGATFTVTKVADTADGVCDADCSLREAISAANAAAGADTVTVPAGTYVLTLVGRSDELNATGDLDITGDLTISGAGAATTIVDGNATDRVFHVLFGATLPVMVTGLTIRNGGIVSSGGGLKSESSTAVVTVDNCLVTANTLVFPPGRDPQRNGGGLLNTSSGTLIVTNSTISNNTGGGGIANNQTFPDIGLGAASGVLTVTNCTITGNTGGGIKNNQYGVVTVTNCTITGNTAGIAGGGGIRNSSGTTTVTGSTVSGNTASGGGGGLRNSSGTLTVVDTTISGNSSENGGAGVTNGGTGPLTITNSTISGNTDVSNEGGGGLSKAFSSTITLANVTIVGNSSTNGGSNITINNPGGSLSLRNTIIANPASGANCAGALPTSLGNNLASDASCNLIAAGDLPNTDPLVGPLANNGGPTQTHALMAASPAIDAGGGCPPPATDQRGVTRPQGIACDIGSFEADFPLPPTPTPTITGTPTPTPTPTPTITGTPTPTPTPTPTLTPTVSVLTPQPMAVDAQMVTGSNSNANGVLQPGETVQVAPSWRNNLATPQAFTGTASNLTGPAGPTYTIDDSSADYGTVNAGATGDCDSATGDCYLMTVSGARPATHWDATFTETLSLNSITKGWTLHIGDSFVDVSNTDGFYRFIETIFHNQVTGGGACGGFCPEDSTLRQEMAVFVLKAFEGLGYLPPACTPPGIFADVPCPGPFTNWIEELSNRGVVAGCATPPSPSYCPTDPVNRQQMAVFLLKTLLGPAYVPPACTPPGIFADVPCPGPFTDWIEDLSTRGITGGCGGGLYCPLDPVKRKQMAVFLTLTFGLVLYGP